MGNSVEGSAYAADTRSLAVAVEARHSLAAYTVLEAVDVAVEGQFSSGATSIEQRTYICTHRLPSSITRYFPIAYVAVPDVVSCILGRRTSARRHISYRGI